MPQLGLQGGTGGWEGGGQTGRTFGDRKMTLIAA